jgi:hypothetical protein
MVAYSTRIRAIKMANNTEFNTWGQKINHAITDMMDAAIAGEQAVTLTSGATHELTETDGAVDEATYGKIVITASIASDATLEIPNRQRHYWIITTGTSGNGSILVKTSGGSALTIPHDTVQLVRCDGSDGVTFMSPPASATDGTLQAETILANGTITDDNGNEAAVFPSNADAVNYVQIDNSATGDAVTFSAVGEDTNIDFDIVAKGSGTVTAGGVDVATIAGAQTLEDKTIDSADNTLTVDFSEATVTGTSADFDAALSDDTFLFRGDMLDEDDFATDSATNPPSQQSTKAYIASQILDEDDFATDSATQAPSQQSAKAYITSQILDEDDFSTDSATQAPSQQSVDAYLTANVARGDAVQSLSTAYKAQARENIDAASVAAMAQQNILVNGCHQISQEHGDTAVTGLTGVSDYLTDQWQVSIAGAGVVTAERDQDGPDGIADSLKFTVTTADASLAAGDHIAVVQSLEQSRIRRLGLGTSGAVASTIGFWIKASTTGTITAFARNYTGSAIDYSWVQDFTIDSSNTWEFKTATIPAQTSGTWGAAVNGYAANFGVCFASGTDAQGTAGWQNANKFATSSTGNLLASTSTTFQITGAFWLPGDQAPSEAEAVLLHRHYDDELRQCKRYWQIVGTEIRATATGGANFFSGGTFTPEMRATPTMEILAGSVNCDQAAAYSVRQYYAGLNLAGGTGAVYMVAILSANARM